MKHMYGLKCEKVLNCIFLKTHFFTEIKLECKCALFKLKKPSLHGSILPIFRK